MLGITGAGFLITAAASYLFQGAPQGIAMIAMLVGFGLLLAISFARANDALSLALFYLFAACEGIGIAPVIATVRSRIGFRRGCRSRRDHGVGHVDAWKRRMAFEF